MHNYIFIIILLVQAFCIEGQNGLQVLFSRGYYQTILSSTNMSSPFVVNADKSKVNRGIPVANSYAMYELNYKFSKNIIGARISIFRDNLGLFTKIDDNTLNYYGGDSRFIFYNIMYKREFPLSHKFSVLPAIGFGTTMSGDRDGYQGTFLYDDLIYYGKKLSYKLSPYSHTTDYILPIEVNILYKITDKIGVSALIGYQQPLNAGSSYYDIDYNVDNQNGNVKISNFARGFSLGLSASVSFGFTKSKY
jgi:hypothetical protein